MWKGLGSALTTRGLLLAVEDCTSKFTPWPIRVDSSSSLRMVGQHLLLKGKLKLEAMIAKSRYTITQLVNNMYMCLLCTHLILQPSAKPWWCPFSLQVWLVSYNRIAVTYQVVGSVESAEILSHAFFAKIS